MIRAKNADIYTASLTGEPFLFNESRILATHLVQGEDIDSLRVRNLKENLILHKKTGSLKRVTTPIFHRLSAMTITGRQLFASADVETARIILLVAIAKTDRLVRDFIVNIYSEKLTLKLSKIEKADIERYFETVFMNEPFLRDRSEQTKAKLKQQLMKIMSEAGLVTRKNNFFLVTRPNISNKLANQLIADGDSVYLKILGEFS